MPTYAQYYNGLDNAQSSNGPLASRFKTPMRYGLQQQLDSYATGYGGRPATLNKYWQPPGHMGPGSPYAAPSPGYPPATGYASPPAGYPPATAYPQQPREGYWDMMRRRSGGSLRALSIRGGDDSGYPILSGGYGGYGGMRPIGGGIGSVYGSYPGPINSLTDPPPAYRPPMSPY